MECYIDLKQTGTDILVFDLETDGLDTSSCNIKSFHAFSEKENKYYNLFFNEDWAEIKEILDRHNVFVTYNGDGFDIPIISRVFNTNYYQIKSIDLLKIIKKRGTLIKYGGFKNNRLVTIAKELNLKNKKEEKFDYEILKKEIFTDEEKELITKYGQQDIEVEKELYYYLYSYFDFYKEYLSKKDVDSWSWLMSSPGTYAYKVICHLSGIKEEWPEDDEKFLPVEFEGGYVLDPKEEVVEGNIYCLDFNCLAKGTKIIKKRQRECNIEDIKIGDEIKGVNKYEKVKFVNKKKVKKICKITLEDGKEILCTKEHKFPVNDINNDVSVNKLQIGDNLIINTHKNIPNTVRKNNPNMRYKKSKIVKIEEVEYNDYVYDIMLENQKLPYFFANEILTHNSAYPHSYIQLNLFGYNCTCCSEDEKYSGGHLFNLNGKYCSKTLSPISQTIKDLYELRLKYKAEKDPREVALKIILNTMYGICGNPVFKNVFNLNTAKDCTLFVRDSLKYASQKFQEAGYIVHYGDTDSVYLTDVFNDEKKLLEIKSGIIEEIKLSLPFPSKHFDMGIDDKIKLMYFPKLKKKNYLYVRQNNTLKIKGLPFMKHNASPISMVIFDKYIRENIIYFSKVKYSANDIKNWIESELKNNIGLAMITFNARKDSDYICKTTIYHAIAEKYGPGLIQLIPNNLGIGIGKSKSYCTLEEFNSNNLKLSDINLSKTYSELNIFSDSFLEIENIKIEKGNQLLRQWLN